MKQFQKKLTMAGCMGLVFLLTGCSLIPSRTHMEMTSESLSVETQTVAPTEMSTVPTADTTENIPVLTTPETTAPTTMPTTVPMIPATTQPTTIPESTTTPAPVPTTGPDAQEKAEAKESKSTNPLVNILEGNGTFLYDGQNVTLDGYRKAFGIPITLAAITLADLEQDGKPEVVLDVQTAPDNSYGVLVLHEEDGQIVGYTFSQRQMGSIKKDGTFYFSGSGANKGVATISLSAGEYAYINHFWGEEDEEGVAHFFTGGMEISSEEFFAAVAEWDNMESYQWKAYPMDSYDSLLGG